MESMILSLLGMFVVMAFSFGILKLLTAWKVFEKYGEPGWKGLIPIYSDYVEYGKVWAANLGLFYCLALYLVHKYEETATGLPGAVLNIIGLAALGVHIIFCWRKAKAFGQGVGLTLVLLFLPFVGNLVIGFGGSEYLGNPD